MKKHDMKDIEEALGIIWTSRERGDKDLVSIREKIAKGVDENVWDILLSQGYIRVDNGVLSMTEAGENIGRDITRRHRLAERLFADVIEINQKEVEKLACEFEHVISADVADSICTLLGHPKVCPHGSPIPAGPCCERAKSSLEAIVVPLNKLSAGDSGFLAYIIASDDPTLHKLMSFGLVPGTEIRLHQTYPSYVIRVNETQIALDRDIAGRIYLRKI